uniref:Uncharacterized protein n=1 Tax=Octopus bimaculoides TaxID=37653 RepID=A0A0L8GXX1_OCTBM
MNVINSYSSHLTTQRFLRKKIRVIYQSPIFSLNLLNHLNGTFVALNDKYFIFKASVWWYGIQTFLQHPNFHIKHRFVNKNGWQHSAACGINMVTAQSHNLEGMLIVTISTCTMTINIILQYTLPKNFFFFVQMFHFNSAERLIYSIIYYYMNFFVSLKTL